MNTIITDLQGEMGQDVCCLYKKNKEMHNKNKSIARIKIVFKMSAQKLYILHVFHILACKMTLPQHMLYHRIMSWLYCFLGCAITLSSYTIRALFLLSPQGSCSSSHDRALMERCFGAAHLPICFIFCSCIIIGQSKIVVIEYSIELSVVDRSTIKVSLFFL